MQPDSSNPNPNHNPSPSPSPTSPSEPDLPPSRPTEHSTDPSPSSAADDAVIDVSGETLDYPLPSGPSLTLSDPKGFYFYKNRVNLLPRWVNSFPKLRTFKFFANDVELLPEGFGGLVGLERLQVRLSVPELGDSRLVDELGKLEGLKELELSNVVRRKSTLHFFAEISRLKCLTRLTLCHFSIRCLPAEIGNLNELEYLDLSFNKMKTLPNEITYLSSLTSLKVASNKLAELPPSMSSMRRLEVLDLSHNRLTSLGALDLCSMQNLQSLNLQYNKIYNCKMPPWLTCKIDENGFSGDESIGSFSEMDVYEATMQEDERSFSHEGSGVTSASMLGPSATSSNGRCFLHRKSSKRWKRTDLQQKARQERLNSSRKGKGEKHSEELVENVVETSDPCDSDVISHGILGDVESEIVGLEDDSDKASTSELNITRILSNPADESESVTGYELCLEDSSGVVLDSINEVGEGRCLVLGCMASTGPSKSEKDPVALKAFVTPNSKRHCNGNLDNPKPCKFRKPTDEALQLSRKYSDISICGVEDYLPDGFYDGGRDQHFMPLNCYEGKLHPDSREVILMDRQRDEVLDAVILTAQALISHFRRLNDCGKDYEKDCLGHLQVASLLALFVSDHFGGCDRTALIERMRKAVCGHNYTKPFICTCSTGNCERGDGSTQSGLQECEDVIFNDLCESSLSSIKSKRKSVIVPIGSLKFGVCRHRALLLKYLCDRMAPPVPCELVRGYLDYMPHAWNVVVMKKGATWVRMVVDACRPYDIREETDPEYFCRYLPLSRINNSDLRETVGCSSECSLPSLVVWDEVETMASTSVVHCKSGSLDVAAKVRTIEVSCNAIDEIRRFECSCLGEVRILGALKHACIVELYGHRISSEWITSEGGNPKRRRLKSAIYMEYIKGGSLKDYLEKLSQSGETHAPFGIALSIAKYVASALVELHSKHIIHRDIKSENVLIDLDEGSSSRIPVVKLCDFDRAVPLKSTLHSCCISHIGVHPPNVCVGTPRWMAPEVLQSMHEQSQYGLEVDIWSYGCLIFELLTLQVPYQEVPDWNIHGLLQSGERPKLTDEIELLMSSDDTATSSALQKEEQLEFDMEALRTLVNLFRRCTQKNPTDRPSAGDIYESLLDHANSFSNICS